MMTRNWFGTGDPREYVVGSPVFEPADPQFICPNCGCGLCIVSVEMKGHPLMKAEYSKGTYLGCPACTFASPMVMVAGDE